MYISKAIIKNFRLLRNSTIEFEKDLSLLLGKNNSGKTSFLKLFENFFSDKSYFTYDDFPLSIREKIHGVNKDTDMKTISIQLFLEITYDDKDNLEHISDFIMDLDEDNDTVNILFECTVKKDLLLKDLKKIGENHKKRYIMKNLPRYLKRNIYVCENEGDMEEDRSKLIEKELSDIKKVINFQVIHAKRDVASSEGTPRSKHVLSELTTRYYNDWHSGDDLDPDFLRINEKLIDMDAQLEDRYEAAFKEFLTEASDFLGERESLRVISNLESESLLQHSSQVIYGSKGEDSLPENLNGLGYMNILYLVLQLEIQMKIFKNEMKNINLLFIEEPEAHTHPQLQYVFARKIKEYLAKSIAIQAVITTHSSHMVSEWNFNSIRYFKINECDSIKNIEIKNFIKELDRFYEDEKEQLKFLKQYLTLFAAELFFAEKIILIEGTTERILLPYFIKKIDQEYEEALNASESKATSSIDIKEGTEHHIPLSSQNVTVLEVGANAKVFEPFLTFFGIKTLIITDIDTIDTTRNRSAVSVAKGDSTSNETLKHFFGFEESDDDWIENLKGHKIEPLYKDYIKVAYQKSESGYEENYQARSYEDAFININFKEVKNRIDNISGLQYKSEFEKDAINIYEFTEKVIKGKSAFASSILYLALTENVDWKIPLYIQEGLRWLRK